MGYTAAKHRKLHRAVKHNSMGFQNLWKDLLLAGIVLGVPTAFFVDKHPWVIALPLVIGTIWFVWRNLDRNKKTKSI